MHLMIVADKMRLRIHFMHVLPTYPFVYLIVQLGRIHINIKILVIIFAIQFQRLLWLIEN